MFTPMKGIQVDKFYPPYDWLDTNSKVIDIRKNAEDNTITLLYGVGAENKYGLFGLLAQVSSGTYDVYIDDVLYATTASNTQTDIDFSTLGSEYVPIGTATTPENLTLHKIVIKPTTSGATITQFQCKRTTGETGTQQQGVLWGHFELSNEIILTNAFSSNTQNKISKAVTAQNNVLNCNNANSLYNACVSLEYSPKLSNCSLNSSCCDYTNIKRIIIENSTITGAYAMFSNSRYLEQINCKYVKINASNLSYSFYENRKLKQFPNIDYTSINSLNYITSLQDLYPTKLDISDAKGLTKLGIYGTSTYPMRGFRGLKVSNEAPFSGSAPQINVNYTGLDRDNLVELFNSLPAFMPLTKEGSPTISNGVVSGFSDSDYLEVDKVFNPLDKNYEIQVSFTTGNSISQQYFFSSQIGKTGAQRYGLILGFNTTNVVFRIGTSNSSFVDCLAPFVLQPNTYYRMKFWFDGQKRGISNYDFNTNTWTNLQEIENSSPTVALTYSYFGLFNGWSSILYVFNGSIDFNNSYIKINDTKYQFRLPSGSETTASNPQCSIVACTGNNLTKVGSPTIDENGVASGFSQSNYLSISNSTSLDNLTFVTKVSGWNTGNYIQVIYRSTNTNLVIRILNNAVQVVSGNTYILQGSALTSYTGDLYIKVVIRNGLQELYLSANGSSWTLDNSNTLETFTFTNILKGTIGANPSNNSHKFLGNIDLENTYIKVGNNYLMKGYITENDKNIALNKNWDLVLS